MVATFDIGIVELKDITKTWWQLALLCLGCAALVLGILHSVAGIILRARYTWIQWISERKTRRATLEVETHLRKNRTALIPHSSGDKKTYLDKPTSCRIYLGPVDEHLTSDAISTLSQHDLIIVDPLQPGVCKAVWSSYRKQMAPRILGRLDLQKLIHAKKGKERITAIQAVDAVLEFVSVTMHYPNADCAGYTGVVWKRWEDVFCVSILHELSKELVARGLEVYLEAGSPEFLNVTEAINSSQISGLIIRNGLIWQNGERRDCFDMDKMRPTIKAFMVQNCLRPFTTIMWEELDDSDVASIAVLRRAHSWHNFHGTLSWISSTHALFHLDTTPSALVPMSAFTWLKEAEVGRLHNIWKGNQTVSASCSRLGKLEEFLPTLKTLQYGDCENCGVSDAEEGSESDEDELGFVGLDLPNRADSLSVSEAGLRLDDKGCFPIGIEVDQEDFYQVVKSQRRLRRLELLDEIPHHTLQEMGTNIQKFATSQYWAQPNTNSQVREAIRNLSDVLLLAPGYQSMIHVYRGLDTGFHCTSSRRFWGVYSRRASSMDLDLYISAKAQDIMCTVVHTYLSSQGCTRRQCFEAEFAYAEWAGILSSDRRTTKRLQQDIGLLTPSEALLLLQTISMDVEANGSSLSQAIYSGVEAKLIEYPSKVQLKTISAIDFLSGSIKTDALVASRIHHYCEHGLRHISAIVGLKLFREVEELVEQILRGRRTGHLWLLTETLTEAMSSATDTTTDIVALAVFCTMRRLAFEEIYVEVTDRNPLFNDQPDQGAAFAELFALGSRCEAYFDMAPSAFGKLMLQKFREQYSDPLRQPPLYKQASVALQTAYSEPQMDMSASQVSMKMPSYQHFTFLGVFALPALIDVLLLTMTKHGLYLSAAMTEDEIRYATVAFMLSLPISGVIGTWIACGGTYYMASMAFSAMNYFVITRLIAGFVFLLISGALGFVIIAAVAGATQAATFFLYFIALTIYLSLLASLANYNINGSSFQSGRATIIVCLPVLFLSPIITFMVEGHDCVIYLAVIYVFISLLLLGTRRSGSLWTVWFHNIHTIDDKALKAWFLENNLDKIKDGHVAFENLSEPALLKIARNELHSRVLSSLPGLFKFNQSKDEVVSRLAGCYQATLILMDWYMLSTGLPQPVPYSSTWNVQSKVALKQLKESQRGIRFHNGFLHWRQAGDEIGCTILYFIIALLDKWIALLSGKNSIDAQSGNTSLQVGFVSTSGKFRFAVGFGLAYYLIGAVLLDYNASALNELAAKTTQEIVRSNDDLPHAIKAQRDSAKALYWKTLRRYIFLLTWSLAITTTLVLFFSDSKEAIVLYFGFVVAYSGLLWYQYTKIFSGPHALKPLIIGLCLALPTGFVLRHFQPRLIYSDVIALGVGTWSVAILSIWAVNIVGKTPDVLVKATEHGYHAIYDTGLDPAWSQDELRFNFASLLECPAEQRRLLSPDSLEGQQIQAIFTETFRAALSKPVIAAFPDFQMLLEASSKSFQHRKVTVELVAMKQVEAAVHSTRAISRSTTSGILILVACNAKFLDTQGQVPTHCLYNVAEIICHTVAESLLGYNHHHAGLAETVLRDTSDPMMRIPHSFTCRNDPAKIGGKRSLITYFKKEMLQGLCLGFAPDLSWDTLPEKLRKNLIQRVINTRHSLTKKNEKYVKSVLNVDNFDVYLARCNYAAGISALYYCDTAGRSLMASHLLPTEASQHGPPALRAHCRRQTAYSIPYRAAGFIWHNAGKILKFFATAFIADAEYQRELNCTTAGYPTFVRASAKFVLNGLWVSSKTMQSFLLPYFLFHNRSKVDSLWRRIQGREVSFKRKHISIQTLEGQYTAFVHSGDDGAFKLYQYRGEHNSEPQCNADLAYINCYSKEMVLLSRQDIQNGEVVSGAEYQYADRGETARKRIFRTASLQASPITRKGTEGHDLYQLINYNGKGLIESGSYIKDGNLIRFHYNYRKSSKMNAELLRAEFVLPHMSCSVSWCTPPLRNPEKLEKWVSYSEVTEAIYVVGQDVWESKWSYDHKYHPTITTKLNGESVETPPLIKYDYLNILSRPRKTSYLDDNPLHGFTTVRPNTVARWLGFYRHYYPFRTSESRYWLWKAWKNSADYDGVVVRWMDEKLLRRDDSLRPYWRKRDWGHLASAEQYLLQNLDSVLAKVDLDKTISSWTPLAIKMNDLLSFGPGGDASGRTRSRLTSQEHHDDASLHVIAVDTGTWPNEGGGVSACRRDVINNLKTIKWHMVVESANDFGIPKHQIEKNVHSLKVIPIWGLDLMTPTHGLFENRLDSEIKHNARHADKEDIRDNFIPILASLISGARSLTLEASDLKQMTRALVNLNAYFGEGSQHWRSVWNSKIVKNAWRRLWLTELTPNVRPCSLWFAAELPTLGQLDEGLELWSRYLFIFSIPVPEKMPDVFQASHHSVSASYGVVCKVRRQCTLQIWDHAISWRETNLYLSSALCPSAPFVRNSLLGLLRMTSVLTLHHADTILPCADFFNPGWEIEIGTCEGSIEHHNSFARKVDPIVNGITDMEQFAPVQEITSKTPTVTMLSHVWYAKDIKTAILAADIIVNEWGFKDYQLDIYGAVDKAPAYSTSCQEIISAKSLGQNVCLRGEADPTSVLEKTWVFLNSSISEGLPLALGEAALTGAPVVCTDVGASLRVLTDLETNECYSSIVAPNDAAALAKAQIHMLAMIGEWYVYSDEQTALPAGHSGGTHSGTTDNITSLPESPTQADIDFITRRMYTETPARRRLGMLGRNIVKKSFDGARYLREHEQMLWIGKAQKDMRSISTTNDQWLVREPSKRDMTNYRYSEIMGYRRSEIGSACSSGPPSFAAMSPLCTLASPPSAFGQRMPSSLSGETRLPSDFSIDTRVQLENTKVRM